MNLIKRVLHNLTIRNSTNNENTPFTFVSKTPPHILYNLICNERNQTIAFIISFWKSKRYIRDFLDLLEKNGRVAAKDFIIGYLRNCPATYTTEVAMEIERVLEKKLAALPQEGLARRKKRNFKQ